MEVTKLNEEKKIDSILNLFKENSKEDYVEKIFIDKDILKKYNENNEKFFIKNQILENNQDQQLFINTIYQYNNIKINLEYFILNGFWKINNHTLNIQLYNILEDINNMKNISFQEQIYLIINKFDQVFNELSLENHLSSNHENDQEQIELPSISDYIQSNSLIPPIKVHRIRQDSSCSSTNSIKYAKFVPPSIVSIRRRKVIQSICLQVQQKKKIFEKLLEQLKQKSTEPTMYELGLEFLRLYDGKFNYPQGYTFVMSFKKRTWYLTIMNIKCVECSLGESEPRSVIILQYKNNFTTVQV